MVMMENCSVPFMFAQTITEILSSELFPPWHSFASIAKFLLVNVSKKVSSALNKCLESYFLRIGFCTSSVQVSVDFNCPSFTTNRSASDAVASLEAMKLAFASAPVFHSHLSVNFQCFLLQAHSQAYLMTWHS